MPGCLNFLACLDDASRRKGWQPYDDFVAKSWLRTKRCTVRVISILSLLALFLCVASSNADLRERRRFDVDESVAPLNARAFTGAYKPNELAKAQFSGNGASCLGLYVFDTRGNCVAMDDVTVPQYCDEAAVEWVADSVGRYVVEIRNAGLEKNKFTLAIR